MKFANFLRVVVAFGLILRCQGELIVNSGGGVINIDSEGGAISIVINNFCNSGCENGSNGCNPSENPSTLPSEVPVLNPTGNPTTSTIYTTLKPTVHPSLLPSVHPSEAPTVSPSESPSLQPSEMPTTAPTVDPSVHPSLKPSVHPSLLPSVHPSEAPTVSPSESPSVQPSEMPTTAPTVDPSVHPSLQPSTLPTTQPTTVPSVSPSPAPTAKPTAMPTAVPTSIPTVVPSEVPSAVPTSAPTAVPSAVPTAVPSVIPSLVPTALPTAVPTTFVPTTAVPTVAPSIVAPRPTNTILSTLVSAANTYSIAGDSAGNIYFTAYGYIAKIPAGTSSSAQFVGGGSNTGENIKATSVSLNADAASSLFVNTAGELLYTDDVLNKLRKVNLQTTIVTTLMGNGTGVYGGDGGPATSASTYYPWGVWSDTIGVIYFGTSSSTTNSVIRKISVSGIVSAAVGRLGLSGYSGNGGPATSAQLRNARRVCGDTSGVLYVMDLNNQVVRRVGSSSIITTYAGINGNTAYIGENLPATSNGLKNAEGVQVDPLTGDLYIASFSNDRVQVVRAATLRVFTFAGNGLRTTPGAGDNGPATQAQISGPYDIFISSTFVVYILEGAGDKVRYVTSS